MVGLFFKFLKIHFLIFQALICISAAIHNYFNLCLAHERAVMGRNFDTFYQLAMYSFEELVTSFKIQQNEKMLVFTKEKHKSGKTSHTLRKWGPNFVDF